SALHLEDEALDSGPVGAAQFPGPQRNQPAFLVEFALPGAADLRLGIDTAGEALTLTQVVGQIVPQKGPDFVTECLLFGGECEIHGVVPLLILNGQNPAVTPAAGIEHVLAIGCG